MVRVCVCVCVCGDRAFYVDPPLLWEVGLAPKRKAWEESPLACCILLYVSSLLCVRRFNYRSTHYMSVNGFYNFLNWFDDRAWYPLGRIVGGTVSGMWKESCHTLSPSLYGHGQPPSSPPPGVPWPHADVGADSLHTEHSALHRPHQRRVCLPGANLQVRLAHLCS